MQKKRMRKKANALPKRARLNGRLFFVGLSMCGMLGILGLIVGKITLIDHETYAQGVLDNMVKSEDTIEAARGTIQDAKGRPLAISLLAYNVILDPSAIETARAKDKDFNLYNELEQLIGEPASQIQTKVQNNLQKNPNSRFFELAKKIELEDEQVEKLSGLEGVTVVNTYKRSYPNGKLAAQVLGFYNGDGEGQYGVEQGYDEYLTGQIGRTYSQIYNSKFTTKEYQAPQKGDTVTLTIDSVIQQYVEETMECHKGKLHHYESEYR